jgi:hypothetical protein
VIETVLKMHLHCVGCAKDVKHCRANRTRTRDKVNNSRIIRKRKIPKMAKCVLNYVDRYQVGNMLRVR